MKSPEERFDLAIEAIESLSKVSSLMSEAGGYNSTAAKSLSELLIILSNVISILDPERAFEYISEKNAAINKDYSPEQVKQIEQYANDLLGGMAGGYL